MKYLLLLSLLSVTLCAADVNLMWDDNSTDEDGFVIERTSGTSGDFIEIGRVSADVISYKDSSLPGGTTYMYRVRAFNTVGSSEPSNTVIVTTNTNSIPVNAKIGVKIEES